MFNWNIFSRPLYFLWDNEPATTSVWTAFHSIVAVMKKELKSRSLSFGLLMALSGVIFVNRDSFGDESKKSLEKQLKQAKRTNTSIWIFPEGTRNKTEHLLLPFKKGAFHMAVQSQVSITLLLLLIQSSY